MRRRGHRLGEPAPSELRYGRGMVFPPSWSGGPPDGPDPPEPEYVPPPLPPALPRDEWLEAIAPDEDAS